MQIVFVNIYIIRLNVPEERLTREAKDYLETI